MNILEITVLSFWVLVLFGWLTFVYYGLGWIERRIDNWLDKLFCKTETCDEADI